MRWTGDETVLSIIKQGGHTQGLALIDWVEAPTAGAFKLLTNRLTQRQAEILDKSIDCIICNSNGLPNGKNKRAKLTSVQTQNLKSKLIYAVEQAAVWAAHGPLPNRLRRPGRPADNAVSIFINDIIDACKESGLKPGLRYVADSESLPVQLFIELAPLLWPGSANNPRKLFERWQRLRPTLVRR
jgi:hypothetical protein